MGSSRGTQRRQERIDPHRDAKDTSSARRLSAFAMSGIVWSGTWHERDFRGAWLRLLSEFSPGESASRQPALRHGPLSAPSQLHNTQHHGWQPSASAANSSPQTQTCNLTLAYDRQQRKCQIGVHPQLWRFMGPAPFMQLQPFSPNLQSHHDPAPPCSCPASASSLRPPFPIRHWLQQKHKRLSISFRESLSGLAELDLQAVPLDTHFVCIESTPLLPNPGAGRRS